MNEKLTINMLNLSRNKRGDSLVVVVVFALALFGFAAVSIDVGNVYVQRKRIHQATDAASLAAVVDWAGGKGASIVRQVGTDFAETNGLAGAEILSVDPGYWVDANRPNGFVGPMNALPTPLPAGAVPAVRVTARRSVQTPFWKVLSLGTREEMTPRVESIAVVTKALSAIGSLPWAVCDSFVPVKCVTVTVQFKSGGEANACSDSGPLSGNFGQLTFPGDAGANDYRNNIINGYQGILRVGCQDDVTTDPGGSWGPTRQGIDQRLEGQDDYVCTATSPPPHMDDNPNNDRRSAIIPKVATLDLNGKKQVCITGFYVVSLDGYSNSKKTVTVTFVEQYSGTEIDPSQPPQPGELSTVGLVK